MHIWLSLSLKKILATEQIRFVVFLLGIAKSQSLVSLKNTRKKYNS